MKKKLLGMLIASLMANSAYADYLADSAANTGTDDNADDIQEVSITVPEVALLDVEDETITLTMTAPTDAGTGFAGVDATGAATDTSTFALSSNIAAASTGARTIDVSLGGGILPEGSTLKIASTGAGTGATASIADTGTVTGNIATAITNERTTAGEITYTYGATTDNTMIAYADAATINVTYTLSTD